MGQGWPFRWEGCPNAWSRVLAVTQFSLPPSLGPWGSRSCGFPRGGDSVPVACPACDPLLPWVSPTTLSKRQLWFPLKQQPRTAKPTLPTLHSHPSPQCPIPSLKAPTEKNWGSFIHPWDVVFMMNFAFHSMSAEDIIPI